MLIKRILHNQIRRELNKEPKIIILYGPRQAGKTTLIRQLLGDYKETYVSLNGDDIRTQELFSIPNLDNFKKIVGNARLLIVDEAQRISNIGLSLKLIFDNLTIPIIASGSSSFELANKINEPLTGRATTFTLYPLSILEVAITAPEISHINRLEEFLRFGLYPKVITLSGEEDKQNYYALQEAQENYNSYSVLY